jgi:hypothetical protein
MRLSLVALLIPSVAISAGAQRRVPPRRLPVPILQTVTVDVASAFQQHYRAMIEPLVFGRFTVGLSGEYTTEPEDGAYDVTRFATPECSVNTFCNDGGSFGYDAGGSGYRAWSFNVHGRWYPRALSSEGQRQSIAVYVGEFIGFHERRTTQPVYYGYGCPACVDSPPRPDSISFRPPPQPYPGGVSAYTQIVHGWEPGAEVGVRVLPMRHIVMDIGGRFRLARIEDYQSGTRPGGVDARLVVAIGAAW